MMEDLSLKSKENEPDETESWDVAPKDTSTKLQKDDKDINVQYFKGQPESPDKTLLPPSKVLVSEKKTAVEGSRDVPTKDTSTKLLKDAKDINVDDIILKETSSQEGNFPRLMKIWADYLLDAIRKNTGGLKELEEKRLLECELKRLEDSFINWKEKQGEDPYDSYRRYRRFRRWRNEWEDESDWEISYYYDRYRRIRDELEDESDWERSYYYDRYRRSREALEDESDWERSYYYDRYRRSREALWESDLFFYFDIFEEKTFQRMKETWEKWTSHTELQEMFEWWRKEMKEDLIMEEIRCQYENIRQLKDIREKKAGILKEKEKSRTDLLVQQEEIICKIRRQRERIKRFLDSRERLLHRMTHETNTWKQMEDKMRKMAGEHKSSGQWCKLKLPEHGMKMIEVKQDHAPLLPRYKYHCLLLDQLRNGIPKDRDFNKWTFNDSPLTVVGNVNKKQRHDLFKNSLEDGLSRDVKMGFEEDILIIYFYTNSQLMIKDIKELRLSLRPFILKTVLIVVKNVEEENHIREEIAKEVVLSRSTHIEFVVESYEEIIGRITVTLEQRISDFLKSIEEEFKRSDQKTYETSKLLLGVNAFLRRLKQAECYPVSLKEEDPKMPVAVTGHKEIDEILDRFGDKILYRGYNGDELKVVTTDEDVKKNLLFKKEGKGEFEINIKDRLEVEELSNPGVSLHGAKHVYREESVSEFKSDNTFATTGSLMAANGDSMVVVTARHGFNGRETDPIYVLIEKEVVRLGGQIQQDQNMKYLHDDIAVVKVENEIRKKVDAKCERLLFHDSKFGTPAKIASHDLKIGDIVHKRGAKTHLTTGVVKDIKTGVIGRFPESSLIIYITGMDGTQLFADKGDSGSLVYQQSLSPTHDVLEVHAMVQGREPDQIQDIICFPFIQGCETLLRNIPDLAPIKFFD